MKYSKYFLIIALFGIVTSCSDFLDRTNPNEPGQCNILGK